MELTSTVCLGQVGSGHETFECQPSNFILLSLRSKGSGLYLPQLRVQTEQKWTSLEQEGIFEPDDLLTQSAASAFPWVSWLPAHPVDFGLSSLRSHMS